MKTVRDIMGPGLLLGISLVFVQYLQADVTPETMRTANPDLDWQALQRGEIVSSDLPDQEVNDAALAVVVGVKLNATIEQVLAQLKQAGPGGKNIAIATDSEQSIASSLLAFRIDNRGPNDIDWFRNPRADGTFNASKEELALLKKAARQVGDADQSIASNTEPFSQAVRNLLAKRLGEYRHGGLKGLTPYDVDGKKIYPGDYLADSLQHMAVLRDAEPDFYQAFLNYPAPAKKAYTQEFYVVQELSEGQPVTSLKHWMVNEQPGSVLIAERKFYISHSLDAMHTLILVMQREQQSYLFMVNLSFTQKVAGIGSFIAHKVGRSKVKDNILPIFANLQAKFPIQ